MPTAAALAAATFLGRSGPRKPLSHERVLELCYAYNRLWEAYRSAAPLNDGLQHDFLEIQRDLCRWEERTAKLRYAARRQAAYRADKAALRDATADPTDLTYDIFSGDPDATTDDATLIATIPDATKAALAKYHQGHRTADDAPTDAPATDRPDTSGYRKSGLV